MIKLITFVFLLLSTLNLFSQHRISGKVIASNNTPLELANVVLFNTKNGEIITGTTTNKNGDFEFTISKNLDCKITISYIGFESWKKKFDIKQSINLGKITLKEVSSLDEVTIISSKKLITKQGDKTIFNVKNSLLKNGYETMELLKVTPYVWIDMNDKISINGENAKILINGRELKLSSNDIQNYLSNISSENIKQIEVQTNKSANSDASTTGGIINIILDKQEKGFRSKINTSHTIKAKSYYSYSNVNFNYGTDKWNIYSSYGFGIYDIFSEIVNTVRFLDQEKEIDTNTEKINQSNNHNYTIGFVNEINQKHQIGFELYGRHSKNDYSRLGKVNYYTNNNLIDYGIIDVCGNGNGTSINGLLNYTWKLSDDDNIKVYLDYSYDKSDDFNISGTFYNNASDDNNENRYNSNSNIKVTALQVDYNKVFKNKINLNTGLKYTNSDRYSRLLSEFKEVDVFSENTNQTTNINFKERISASYISADKEISKKNYLKIGIRTEYTEINKIDFITKKQLEKSYINFFPSFYYSRTLTKKKSLSISYSHSLKRPHFGLLNDDVKKVNDFQYYIGNPDLNPEFTDKYELKYNYNKHYFSTYYKNTKDKITDIYSIEDGIAYYKTINLGYYRRFGVNYNFTKKIKNWWRINMSSYLFNGRFINENKKASFIQTSYGFSLNNGFKINKTTKIDLSGYYGSPSTMAFYQGYEFYSANLAFKKSFLNRKLNLNIYFKDIFNTFSYKTLREFKTFYAYYERKPSRSVRFKLTYNISNNKKVRLDENKSKNEIKQRI